MGGGERTGTLARVASSVWEELLFDQNEDHGGWICLHQIDEWVLRREKEEAESINLGMKETQVKEST